MATPSLLAMAAACSAALAGYELCAERTHDVTIAVAARNAATNLRALLRSLAAAPSTRMCDRLRWEWLASTGTVLDGAPDARLFAECSRILGGTRPGADVDAALIGRYLAASAEAYSLAAALAPVRGISALAFT